MQPATSGSQPGSWGAGILPAFFGMSDVGGNKSSVRPSSTAGIHSTSTARSVIPIWLAAFVLSFLLYAATAGRGAQWQDGGVFILRTLTHDLRGSLGLALSHPLHHWLTRLAVRLSSLEPAFVVTLVSSLAAAIAVANVLGCVRTLTGRVGPAVFAAASLALANTFWHMATTAEVYTLSAALLTGECWCLIHHARTGSRRALLGMFLLNGLGLANHLQAILTTPVLAIYAWGARRSFKLGGRDATAATLLWLLGSLPYTGLVVLECLGSGDPAGTLRSALFGTVYAGNVLNASISPHILALSAGWIGLSFPSLFLPAAVVGLAVWRKTDLLRAAGWALVAGLVLHAGFALRYNVVDQHTFFLPMYVLLSLFAGLGAARTTQWLEPARRWARTAGVALLVLTPLVYGVAPAIARRAQVLGTYERHRPYRDDYRYLLWPWTVADRSAQRMADEAVDLAGAGGLIICESGMADPAVRYVVLRRQVSGLEVSAVWPMRTPDDARAFLDHVRDTSGGWRRVVLVPDNAEHPRARLPAGICWSRRGDLYLLDVATASSPASPVAVPAAASGPTG